MKKIFTIFTLLSLILANFNFFIKKDNLTIVNSDEQWADEVRVTSFIDIPVNLDLDHFLFTFNNGQFDKMKAWRKFSFNLGLLRQEQIISIVNNYWDSCAAHMVVSCSYGKYSFGLIDFSEDFRNYFFSRRN